MKKHYQATLASLALALCCTSNLAAQKYPAEDADGEKIYYKIANAYPEYSQKCIEYQAPGTNGYYFVVNDMESDNPGQEWEIVAAANDDSGQYYLRNRRSRRYIGSAGEWKGDNFTPNAVSTRESTSPFTFEDLDNGQIVIKTGEGDDTRFLYAADSVATSRPAYNRYAMENSVWAWTVSTAGGTSVSVPQLLKDNRVKVTVENRVIKVEGAERYSLYNDEGARLAAGSTLAPGVYFVSVGGVSYKVLVK